MRIETLEELKDRYHVPQMTYERLRMEAATDAQLENLLVEWISMNRNTVSPVRTAIDLVSMNIPQVQL